MECDRIGKYEQRLPVTPALCNCGRDRVSMLDCKEADLQTTLRSECFDSRENLHGEAVAGIAEHGHSLEVWNAFLEQFKPLSSEDFVPCRREAGKVSTRARQA